MSGYIAKRRKVVNKEEKDLKNKIKRSDIDHLIKIVESSRSPEIKILIKEELAKRESHERVNKLFERNHKKPWNMSALSRHINLDPLFLKRWRHKDWDWSVFHGNPTFNINLIDKFPKKDWSYCSIDHPVDFLMSHPHLNWRWWTVDVSKVPIEFIIDHINFDWNWYKIFPDGCPLEFFERYIAQNPKVVKSLRNMRLVPFSFAKKNPDFVKWHPQDFFNLPDVDFFLTYHRKYYSLSDAIKMYGISPELIINNMDIFNEFGAQWISIFSNQELRESLMAKVKPTRKWDRLIKAYLEYSPEVDIEKFKWFPDAFLFLSKNEHLTISMVQAYPDADWKWDKIHGKRGDIYNPKLDRFVLAFPDKPWNWSEIVEKVSTETILLLKDKPWPNHIMNHTDLRLKIALPNSFFNIKYDFTRELDCNWALENKEKVNCYELMHYHDWVPPHILKAVLLVQTWEKSVSTYKYINNEYLSELGEAIKMLEFISILEHPEVGIEFILENIHLAKTNQDMSQLTKNKKVDYRRILDNPQINWDLKSFIHNPNFTETALYDMPNFDWDWAKLSFNKNINANVVEHFINKPWDFSILSTRNDIFLFLAEKYPEKDWDWSLFFYEKQKYENTEKLKLLLN